MVTDYIEDDLLRHILATMMPANARACRVSLATGLRIGDVLQLRTEQLQKQRFTIREEKTNKSRRIYLPKALWHELKINAGDLWAFPGRDPLKHRTRQAVWKDIKRAQKMLRIESNIGAHSMRKIAAVHLFKKTGDLLKVQELLNHDHATITTIYALADSLSAANKRARISAEQKRKKKKKPP